MRAGAQVGEVALFIEGDDGVLGKVVNELHLVGLAALLHKLDGLGAGQLKALQLELFLADFAHLGLQLGELGLGEGLGGVEIIVEAVFNGGADGELDLGMQPLHGLGQNVRTGVPVGFAVAFVFKGVQVFLRHQKSLLKILRGK